MENMQKSLLLIPLLLIIAVPSADAVYYLEQDQYVLGDFLEIRNTDGMKDMFIMIFDENGKRIKNLVSDMRGNYGVGIPLTPLDLDDNGKWQGFEKGTYKVILREKDKRTQTQYFDIYNTDIPKLTLNLNSNVFNYADDLFVHGIMVNDFNPNKQASKTVTIEIFDSEGNPVKNGMRQPEYFGNFADWGNYKITSIVLHGTKINDNVKDRNLFVSNNIPLEENGYRHQLQITQNMFEPFETYTLRVSSEGKMVEEQFSVNWYGDDVDIQNESLCDYYGNLKNELERLRDIELEKNVDVQAKKLQNQIDIITRNYGC